MYGMTPRLTLQADRPGVYAGLSAHFSGDGFPGMAFDVQAVSPEQFTSWVVATGGRGPVLDDAAYRSLLKQSQDVTPYTCGAVQAGLFEQTVGHKSHPEGEPTSTPAP